MPIRTLLPTLILIIAAAALPVAAAEPAHAGILECQGRNLGEAATWTIRFDDAELSVIVNGQAAKAKYTAKHMRIDLTAPGQTLLIGRVTGRLVVTAPDGSQVGAGICAPSAMI